MPSRRSAERKRAEFVESAEAMYERMVEWREQHPEASFDEIAEQVGYERRQLMSQLLEGLATQHAVEVEALAVECPECREKSEGKGQQTRHVSHSEGEVNLSRGYRYCRTCGKGFFPLDRKLNLSHHNWSPKTIRKAVRLGVEIASFERAADAFTELTQVGLSKSSLQRLTEEMGDVVVRQQAAEALAMVRVPKQEEEVLWRAVPEPDSKTMAVSSDGVMVNIREEGWKEVKTVSVSAVTSQTDEQTGEKLVQLSQHSYRAGLWDAKTFTNHHWAEACRPGLEKAQRIVCISDGAAWDPEGTPGHGFSLLQSTHRNPRLVACRATALGYRGRYS